MTTLVSITARGETARLRRYEVGNKGAAFCTHAGSYAAEGVTLVNVEYYRAAGAPQDRVGHRDQATATALRRAATPA